jgi:hypothetical protein
MKTQSRLIASATIASVLLLNMSSASLANGAPNRRHEHDTVVTFTKWVTAVVPPNPGEAAASRFLMAGIVGGDVAGDFVGEVLDRRVSTTGTITAQIVALDALYEVRAGDHSFTALIQGGQNNTTRKALLEGVILDGWRTGARVHVEFTVISGCAGKPAGPCFEGTIRILRDSDDSHE